MNKELERAWNQAEANPGTPIDIGRIVVCDFCDGDHTDTTVSGGVIFGSKAVCPTCMPKVQAEAQFIKARYPEGKSFGDFVREYRGSNNSIVIRTAVQALEPRCRSCKQPFSDKNVHTDAGRREIQISGICEDCFDRMFEEEG
jgi:hypothetical protein